MHELLLEITDLRLRDRVLSVELIEILVKVLDESFQFRNCGRHFNRSLVLGRGTLIRRGRLSWLLILRLIVHLRSLVLISRCRLCLIGRSSLLLRCSVIAVGRLLRLTSRVGEG